MFVDVDHEVHLHNLQFFLSKSILSVTSSNRDNLDISWICKNFLKQEIVIILQL